MSDTEKLPTNYGKKKYRYLSQDDSDALKELLPINWPDRIIESVKKDLKKNDKAWPRVPSGQHLYSLVNGRIRDFTFMPLVKDLALEKKKITDEIKNITKPQKEGAHV